MNFLAAFGYGLYLFVFVVTTQAQEHWLTTGLPSTLAQAKANPPSIGNTRTPKEQYGTRLFGKSALSRNIMRDIRFVGETGLSDVIWVYSSPDRVKPRALKYLAGVLAVGAGIYMLDDELSSALHRNKDHWMIEPFHEAGEFLEPIGRQGTMNKYFLGTAAASYIIGFEWLSRMSSEILESYLIAGPPKIIVNKVTGRPRPIEGYSSNHWDFFEPGQSFFSGHSSHAFQVARIMDENIHFVPLDVMLYLCAASVAFQRVDARWHWASDVWVGSAYGFVIADALAGRHRIKWANVQPFGGGPDGASGLWLSFRL